MMDSILATSSVEALVLKDILLPAFQIIGIIHHASGLRLSVLYIEAIDLLPYLG